MISVPICARIDPLDPIGPPRSGDLHRPSPSTLSGSACPSRRCREIDRATNATNPGSQLSCSGIIVVPTTGREKNPGRAALCRQLEQLVYEAKKAFEQYDAVDARNRLAASELERRWNEKLEEIEAVKQRLSSLDAQRYSLSPEEEIRIRSMGDHFAGVWQSDHCPPTLKKMIFRTAIEDIIVRTDQDKRPLSWRLGVNALAFAARRHPQNRIS
jgi:hypothetical protein